MDHFLKSSVNLLQFCFCCMFFGFSGHRACGIFAPWPAIKSTSPASDTREVPGLQLILKIECEHHSFIERWVFWGKLKGVTGKSSGVREHFLSQGRLPGEETLICHLNDETASICKVGKSIWGMGTRKSGRASMFKEHRKAVWPESGMQVEEECKMYLERWQVLSGLPSQVKEFKCYSRSLQGFKQGNGLIGFFFGKYHSSCCANSWWCEGLPGAGEWRKREVTV